MTFALATLTFLSLLWLLAVLGAMVFEQSGAKIRAALKGVPQSPAFAPSTIRIRYRSRSSEAVRATPRLRAAA